MGAATRLCDRPDDPDPVGRVAQDRNRIALPGAAPPRKTGLGDVRVAPDRGQPARQVLPADAEGQEAAAAGARSLVAAGLGDRHDPQTETIERLTMGVMRWLL